MSDRGVSFSRRVVVILPCVSDDVVAGPQVLLDGFLEESRVAVVDVEFDEDRPTHLRRTSYGRA
jgi:hypothetical protein